jgi:DNA-binding response OmpR family regulator
VPVRILLIEDEPALCLFIERALSRAGYEIVCEQRGDDGLRKALEDRFDLIIADGHLPGLSGLDVLRTVKAQVPETQVMILSGLGSDFQGEAMDSGADCFQAKPCGLDIIVNAVDSMVGMKRAFAFLPSTAVN